MNKIIDTSGFSCPQPLLMVNSYLVEKSLPSFTVLVDNEASKENITRAAKKQGWKVEIHEENENQHKLEISQN